MYNKPSFGTMGKVSVQFMECGLFSGCNQNNNIELPEERTCN